MATEPRVPVFELHIRPMFRLLDREHMMKWVLDFDLWDLTQVWENRHSISTRIKRDMPGERFGGPYPEEWIQLFDRWLATGSDTELGHHLVLAVPQGEYEIQVLGADKRRLSVKVLAPTEGCRAWFELDSVTPSERHYTLYLEPAFPKQEAMPTIIDAREPFKTGGATRLFVNDANGSHEIILP